jgi:hypothetical protein
MKKISIISILLIVASLILQAGCKSGETSSNLENKAASQPPTGGSNANQSQPATTANTSSAAKPTTAQPATAGAPAGPAEPKPAGKAELVGTYESREVQDKGVVTLISQLRTLWMFSSDGSYSRVSEVKGKPYHADSGSFRIEPPDKLILNIQVTGLKTQRKMQNPPLSKTHKFELSADGEELRLISEKGSVGIFRRISRPNQ